MSTFDVNTLLNRLREKEQSDSNVQLFINGLERYGYNKPIIAPTKVSWDLTTRCNLDCKHCSRDASSSDTQTELTFDEIKDILYDFKEFGIKNIAYSGGEFMVRDDYQQIITLTVELGMKVFLITNCTMVTEKVAQTWANLKIKAIQTSLDGSNAETHDAFRGRKGAFEKALKGIDELIKTENHVIVSFTISKHNYKELEDTINLCIERKIPTFTVNDLLPVGRGKNLDDLILDNSQYNNLVSFFRKRKEELRGKINLAWEGVGNFKKDVTDAQRTLIKSQCGACLTSCHITSCGDVVPCNILYVKTGNLRDNTLKSIWENTKVFEEMRNRDNLGGNCGKCDFRYSCGGCRARAHAYTGNYMAADPRCNYRTVKKRGDES